MHGKQHSAGDILWAMSEENARVMRRFIDTLNRRDARAQKPQIELAHRRSVKRISRLLRPLWGIPSDAIGGWRITADWRSFLRYVMDIFLFRLLYFAELPGSDRERSIRLKGDVVLTYRLNRGDIQGIREVWVHQIRRPPVDLGPVTNVVDSGAISDCRGCTCVRRLGCERLIAVEPDDRNVQLAARNFKANGVEAQLLSPLSGCETALLVSLPHGSRTEDGSRTAQQVDMGQCSVAARETS